MRVKMNHLIDIFKQEFKTPRNFPAVVSTDNYVNEWIKLQPSKDDIQKINDELSAFLRDEGYVNISPTWYFIKIVPLAYEDDYNEYQKHYDKYQMSNQSMAGLYMGAIVIGLMALAQVINQGFSHATTTIIFAVAMGVIAGTLNMRAVYHKKNVNEFVEKNNTLQLTKL